MQGRYLTTNTATVDSADGGGKFDSNTGFYAGGFNSTYQGWMWKRHAGFDVVTWKNDTTNTFKSVRHNLGKKPEMIWLKSRSGGNTAQNKWYVWHSDLTANGSLHSQYIVLNTNDAQATTGNLWGDSGSYLTNASFGYWTGAVGSTSDVIAMLFASVSGVSAVGSYTGTGSDLTITLGFQPRFVLIKDIDNTASWHLFDTLRGIASGTDKVLLLNDTGAQTNTEDRLDLTSDGMTLHSAGSTNENNVNFIYYAHA